MCTSVHEPSLWLPISTRPKGFPCAKRAPFCAIVLACSSVPAASLRPLIGSLSKSNPNTMPLRQNCAKHRHFIVMRPVGGSPARAGGWGFLPPKCSPFLAALRARGGERLGNILEKVLGGFLVSDGLVISDDALR